MSVRLYVRSRSLNMNAPNSINFPRGARSISLFSQPGNSGLAGSRNYTIRRLRHMRLWIHCERIASREALADSSGRKRYTILQDHIGSHMAERARNLSAGRPRKSDMRRANCHTGTHAMPGRRTERSERIIVPFYGKRATNSDEECCFTVSRRGQRVTIDGRNMKVLCDTINRNLT